MINNCKCSGIDKVYFVDPVTVVVWSDQTVTIVRNRDGEKFDPEKMLAMSISKKFLGNSDDYYEEFKKWIYPRELNIDEIGTIVNQYADMISKITDNIVREIRTGSPKMMFIREYAEAIGLPVNTVYQQIINGEIPDAKLINGLWMIPYVLNKKED